MKTGNDHIESLRDGRTVYVNGEVVSDIVSHPAYRHTVQSVARLYDQQADPVNQDRMTFTSPTNGLPVSRCWQLPRTYQDLVQRRESLTAWAESSYGFFGRSPDHVASCLAGMVMGIEVFEQHGKERGRAVLDYFTYARDHDLFLTYTIVNPPASRLDRLSGDVNDSVAARICDEDAEGITVHGSKMLGTNTIASNEVLVTTISPLQPGQEDLAFTAAVPLNSKGLKLLSRKSYEAAAVSEFDNPLSTHFDENDAILYFDNVKIPWERVFVYRDVQVCQAQFHEAPTHILQNYQALIRFVVKLKFLLGLARKLTELNGTIKVPQVVQTLGHLSAQTSMIEGLLYGMEVAGTAYGDYYIPNRRMVYAGLVSSQDIYPQVVQTVRELAGGGAIMMPSSSADFAHPEIAPFIRSAQGETQKDDPDQTTERVKLFKLAWDAVGSEFASRHLQYEMFYASAPYVRRSHAFRTSDWDGATGLVDHFLTRYDLPNTAT